MIVKAKHDFQYSLDGFTIIIAYKDNILGLDDETAQRFIGHGYVEEVTEEVPLAKSMDLFSPVEETAVIEPVKEKKRRRKKKAE